MENMIMVSQGGADRRPGTRYVATGKTAGKKVRLIPFDKGTSVYVLEFGHNYIRVYKNHQQIEDAGAPVEIVTTYAEDDLFELKYAQTEDALYVVHRDYAPAKITNTDDVTWTFDQAVAWGEPDFNTANKRPAAIAFYQQRLIFASSNNKPQTIWCSNVGNPEDFSAGNYLEFKVYHHKRVQIEWLAGKKEVTFGATSAEGVLQGGEGGLNNNNYNISVQDGAGCSQVQGHLVGNQVVFVQRGGRRVRLLQYNESQQTWETVDATFFAGHITGTGIVEAALQINPDTILWCVRSDGVLAALTLEPKYGVSGWHRHLTDGEIESVCVIPNNAAVPDYNSEANEDEIWISVKRTIGGNVYRYIEYFIPRSFSDQTDQQSYCFFVDSGITTVMAGSGPVLGLDRDVPLTVVTSGGHGFDNGDKVRLSGLGGATELNGQVFTVENVDVTTFKLAETDDYTAWDGDTEYYIGHIVKYGTKLYIALQDSLDKQPDTETDYWKQWPSALTSSGTALEVTQSVTGLEHLEWETVDILADGGTHAQKDVDTGGVVTLDRYAHVIVVGLPYISYLEPMRLEVGGTKGTSQGKPKRISSIVIRFFKTLGCKVGPNANDLRIITFRRGSDSMDSPPPLYTGDKRVTFPSIWNANGDICLVQDQPLPMSVVAIIPDVITND
jgi:hypothetical protein